MPEEEQLTRVAQLIFNKIPELGRFTLEDIKEFIKMRANELINTH